MTIKHFWSASKEQAGSVWKTYWNVKKWWLYNSKYITLFVSSKIYKRNPIDLSRQKLIL